MQNLLDQYEKEQLSVISTYFGIANRPISNPCLSANEERKDGNEEQNSLVVKNDIVLKDDGQIGNNHFRIRYCPYKNKYLIKDMGDGLGTFIRVEDPTILQSGTVICIGESHLIVGLIFENLEDNCE